MDKKKIKKGDEVIIRLWTDSQSGDWSHRVTSIKGKSATLDNGDKVSLEIGEDNSLTVVKAPPLFCVYGKGLVKRSYTLCK